MFWKGFRPLITSVGLLTLTACSHYPFKYDPYSKPQSFSSWSEMEATVKRLESYAENCRPEQVSVGSCTVFNEEYEHTLLRIETTEFRLAPAHVTRLNEMHALYRSTE